MSALKLGVVLIVVMCLRLSLAAGAATEVIIANFDRPGDEALWSAGDSGGGAQLKRGGVMNNCTLGGNTSTLSSEDGGGAYLFEGGTLNNCIVSGNTQDGAWNIGVSGAGTTVRYTCSPGLSGSGNLTNAPLFVNAAANNYRLLAGSPCIDAGTNEAWIKADHFLKARLESAPAAASNRP